jgi:hypothetical protein
MKSLHLFQMLNQEECDSYLDKIHSLKNHWIQRSAKKLPFFTLGMAAYQDRKGEYHNLKKRARYNKILHENFSELYGKLIPTLSKILKAPVEIYDKVSIPGFHIYMPHKELKDSKSVHQSTPHLDTQFRVVFKEKGIKPEDFVSFTLALQCSKKSGLNLWEPKIKLPKNVLDEVTEDTFGFYFGTSKLSRYIEQAMFEKPTTFLKYKPGSLAVHQGIYFHYPVLGTGLVPRITLQGHGVKKKGKFLLFW